MKNYFFPLVENPYRKKDLDAATKVINSGKITIGKVTDKLERTFSKKFKINNALMVNSGSSANLLAFQCLINPYRKNRLKPGDQVIVPSLCWSTSLWPIIQSGLKPVFVEVSKKTLNLDLKKLVKKINKKTKAIMLVHVLGNSTEMNNLMKIVKKYNLFLIEDTCESLGSKYSGKYLGTFGDFSTFSFYSSHQISSGEGGMICCKKNSDYEILKSLRSHGWSRGLKHEKKIARQNPKLDRRFIFYNSGFNLRPTDISASIGLSQFSDFERLKKERNLNRDKIVKALKSIKKIDKNFYFVEKNNLVEPFWFSIPILIKDKNKRKRFIEKIEKKGVETRPIISGNFLKQPSIFKYGLHTREKFLNSDTINDCGFFIGIPNKKINQKLLNKLIYVFESSI